MDACDAANDQIDRGRDTSLKENGYGCLANITNLRQPGESAESSGDGFSSSSRAAQLKNLSAKHATDSKEEDSPGQQPASQSELSPEQKAVLQIIKSRENIFFTGAAGTRKSFLLREVVDWCRQEYGRDCVAVTAPTGVAALHIEGRTPHSRSGIGLGKPTKEKLVQQVIRQDECRRSQLKDAKKAEFDYYYSTVGRWKRCKVLMIDESKSSSLSLINGG